MLKRKKKPHPDVALLAGCWRDYARRIRRGIVPGATGPAVDVAFHCADCAEQLADDIEAITSKLAGLPEDILKQIIEESP